MKKEDLEFELFQMSVKITNTENGKMAKWENNKHPDNNNYMQIVYWMAFENVDKTKIIIRYSLDNQLSKIYDHVCIENINNNFNELLFNFWINH